MRFFQWLFGASAQTPQAAPQLPEREGFFTTEVDTVGLLTKPERLQNLLKLALPVTKVRLLREEVATDGAVTYAEDSVDPASSLKSQFALGNVGVPEVSAYWYGSQGFIGYQLMAVMAQHWLVNKACLMPARDAVRKGFKITSNDGSELNPKMLDAINRANKRYKLAANLVQMAYMNRVFGIRVALFKVESADPEYYQKPFNPDSVTPGSYRGISQIDPYWIIPELTTSAAFNPDNIDFYEPTYWVINEVRYHKSHLVVNRGPEVPDILKPSYLYGGLSLVQRIYERVYASERTANEAPMLALNKRTTVFYTDVEKALGNQAAFEQRLGFWARFRDNWGMKIASKDVDKLEQVDTSLADLDSVIMTQYQLVAALAGVPATKLLGTTPKGFNSSGDYETESYHEELSTIQEELEPLVDRHLVCLIRSEVAPRFQVAPFGVDCTWNPVNELGTKEQAEVNKMNAETDQILVACGAIDGGEIRNRLTTDEDSGHSGLQVLTNGDA